ncbi:uncharacterized protein EV154DRAFT_545536 [Mucor mucedo]|uniref:uncharacterized protein n=1 Tax=Mucor mucedo TaxID=29922 RepID=UPI00222009CD|nr:uncharacterized protein EV154DRAFT_545536 [Mucor mucedo]KAI7882801.1 hypothetical protein EV154DRAFT_545536 [Mucor mucedo]
MKLLSITYLAFGIFVRNVIALNVTTIAECPTLSPRTSPAKDITDLRVDDIKIFGALGDSIMAGFGMIPINPGILGFLNINALTEYRGSSYLMGTDKDAITVANFIKHYNPNLHGPSTGSHVMSYVRGDFPGLYYEDKDYLNAAQTGAMAMNLNHELNYLLPNLKDPTVVGTSAEHDWKMISIAVGSNDICRSCSEEFDAATTADLYAHHIETAIQRIQSEVSNVIINLMGMFKLSDLDDFYNKDPEYCSNRLLLKPCDCFYAPNGLEKVEAMVNDYNIKLQEIADKYPAKPGSTFGVMFTPVPFDILSFPANALSNIDCFHPSVLGHRWFAKAFWNQIFLNKELKPITAKYDMEEQIYCPTDNDRIQVS